MEWRAAQTKRFMAQSSTNLAQTNGICFIIIRRGEGRRRAPSKYLNISKKNVKKQVFFVFFYFLWPCCTSPSGSEKIHVMPKGKTNFLKNPAGSSPNFLNKFLKFSNPANPPPPLNRREKIWKNLTYTPAYQLFCVKISKFLSLPFQRYGSLNFDYLRSYYSGWSGGIDPKIFWEGFTSRLTFWVSFSPIGENGDFTILCRKALSHFNYQILYFAWYPISYCQWRPGFYGLWKNGNWRGGDICKIIYTLFDYQSIYLYNWSHPHFFP